MLVLRKLEKFKTSNYVEGQNRKLQFTVLVMPNLGFSCIECTFSTEICDEYFKGMKKK